MIIVIEYYYDNDLIFIIIIDYHYNNDHISIRFYPPSLLIFFPNFLPPSGGPGCGANANRTLKYHTECPRYHMESFKYHMECPKNRTECFV